MKMNQKPSMILFDYGLTLLCEPDFEPLRGDRVLSQFITKNPNHVSVEDISACARRIFLSAEAARAAGFEMHEHALLRLLNDSLGLEYSISLEEQEWLFWENASTAEPMPQVEMLLEYLHAASIRTAVVSNISFSEHALKRKIDTALPNNHFEFVLASSEYGVRKPNPLIFQAALQRARVAPEDAWFCGDNFETDIKGAAAAGIFPVWYHEESCRQDLTGQEGQPLDYFQVSQWQDLIDFVKKF